LSRNGEKIYSYQVIIAMYKFLFLAIHEHFTDSEPCQKSNSKISKALKDSDRSLYNH
jgi:hypothetical protein